MASENPFSGKTYFVYNCLQERRREAEELPRRFRATVVDGPERAVGAAEPPAAPAPVLLPPAGKIRLGVELSQSLAILVVVQLIHRLTEADISSTTVARLFFFTLLVHAICFIRDTLKET